MPNNKTVHEIYYAAITKLDGDSFPLHFGPSHIVWEDENFDDESIDFCLEKCKEPETIKRFSPDVIAVIRESLIELKQVSATNRVI